MFEPILQNLEGPNDNSCTGLILNSLLVVGIIIKPNLDRPVTSPSKQQSSHQVLLHSLFSDNSVHTWKSKLRAWPDFDRVELLVGYGRVEYNYRYHFAQIFFLDQKILNPGIGNILNYFLMFKMMVGTGNTWRMYAVVKLP